MSKIGKKPIQLPEGVQVTLEGSLVTVRGPKGMLQKEISSLVTVTVADGVLTVVPVSKNPNKEGRTHWGLWRALINNMVIGVSTGWEEVLEFQGVGYKATLKGADLELSLGYSHPITVTPPEGVTFAPEKSSITISGIDKERVGHIAAHIRSLRPPEPYKGSGIRYAGEVVRRKAGKKAATAA